MFGFSRRKTKLGRLKVHLGDASHGGRSPARASRRLSQANAENAGLASGGGGGSQDPETGCSSSSPLDLEKPGLQNINNWVVLNTKGNKPPPRFHHAASVVGSKMVVVGGDSGDGLLDDTWILSLDKLQWAAASPKGYMPPSGVSLKIPAFRGHCVASWGTMLLLIGGEKDPDNDRLSVWSFDVETERWLSVEAKGDIPVARRGHVVIRAGSFLILFGGPCPRSNHAAALYDDKVLLVFGGQSKSKFLNDLFALDFETMVWSRIKIKGHHPSPRAGCRGALCGNKWYIVGGGSKKKRYAETLCFDVVSHECCASVSSPNTSITMSKGFSLVSLTHMEKNFLVAFGGSKKEPSNQVEVMAMVKKDHSMSWRCASDIELASHLHSDASMHTTSSFGRQSLASAMELSTSGRKSLSDSPIDPNSASGMISLRRQFDHEEGRNPSPKTWNSVSDNEKYKISVDSTTDRNPSCQSTERRRKLPARSVREEIVDILPRSEEIPSDTESSMLHRPRPNDHADSDAERVILLETQGGSAAPVDPSKIYHLYETKMAAFLRKNIKMEEQLAASLAHREAAEKSLSSATRSKKDAERRLVDAQAEAEALREKLAGMELAHEEANSLSNLVHSDNVRLEHDVAFLKAVLDDTQKELRSIRGVLAGERARAFQLQIEVYHLKQRLQTMENRAPTPRKTYHV